MQLSETITLDASARMRKTAGGYLVAEPRVARTGVQLYQGVEVGRPELNTVRVNRPKEVVFDTQSLQSYAHRPITMGHPDVPVTSDNWRDYAIGHVGGEVIRDGEYIRVPILLMDRAAIDAVESGEIKQLSLGYQMGLDWAGGDGFDATVTDIVANHLAVVPSARGGPKLAIGDDKDRSKHQMTTDANKTVQVTIDGIGVQVADSAAPIIQRYIKDQEQKLADAAAAQTKLKQAADDLEGKIKKLEAEKVTLQKQVEEAKLSSEQLDDMVKERDAVISVAAKVLGKDECTGSTAELRKKVVLKKVGDLAKDWNDEQIAASFNTLNIDAQPNTPQHGGATRFQFDPTKTTNDARSKAVAGYNEYLTTAWKGGESQEVKQ